MGVTMSIIISLTYIEVQTKWSSFAENIFKRILLNENVRISINISLHFVP